VDVFGNDASATVEVKEWQDCRSLS
jgi:hypothetical protein